MDDKSFQLQPKLMSATIAKAIIQKAYSHCIRNGIDEFLFAFHGGEPLLQSEEFYIKFIEQCKKVFQDKVKVHYCIQTNGTLLTDKWARLFVELQIQIGVSLDGLKAVNDQNRIYKNEKGSFDNVIKGISSAMHYPFHQKKLGLLAVVNTLNDPIELFEFINSLGVKNVDFLFPYNHFNDLPPQYTPNDPNCTPYADWLLKLYDYWFKDHSRINIRMFKGFIESIFGEEYPTDLFGSYYNGLLVIETNGDIEAVDYLKACGDSFTKTDLNIINNELDHAVNSALINLYYHSHRVLNVKCENCYLSEICGGGNLTSRFNKNNGFDNPSFLCFDFIKIITHIQNSVLKNVPLPVLEKFNLSLMSFDEVRENISNIHPSINEYLDSFKIKNNEFSNTNL